MPRTTTAKWWGSLSDIHFEIAADEELARHFWSDGVVWLILENTRVPSV